MWLDAACTVVQLSFSFVFFFFSWFQQLNLTEVKVDKVQVSGAGNTTFAVCLDQDEKKVLQSVTRSE